MALYYELSNKASELAYAGRLVYKEIDWITVLDQVMHQGGNNTKSATFKSIFVKLCNNTIGKSTWRLLLTKCKQNLPANKIASFDNTIWLFGTRAAVGKYNYNRIRDLQQPILPIHTINTGIGASKAILEQCNTVLKLCIC